MKKLTDKDIAEMAGEVFLPEDSATRRSVRAQLHLSRLSCQPEIGPADGARLDLHQYTQEQAWSAIMDLAQSGVRHAIIITGASGILHQLFPQWATESILTPYVESFKAVNNGSFAVVFRRLKK